MRWCVLSLCHRRLRLLRGLCLHWHSGLAGVRSRCGAWTLNWCMWRRRRCEWRLGMQLQHRLCSMLRRMTVTRRQSPASHRHRGGAVSCHSRSCVVRSASLTPGVRGDCSRVLQGWTRHCVCSAHSWSQREMQLCCTWKRCAALLQCSPHWTFVGGGSGFGCGQVGGRRVWAGGHLLLYRFSPNL